MTLYVISTLVNAFDVFYKLYKKVENEKGCKIVSIISDHGGEFENNLFKKFCKNSSINHNFSFPRTPQQNGITKRKNISLREMVITMLNNFSTPNHL